MRPVGSRCTTHTEAAQNSTEQSTLEVTLELFARVQRHLDVERALVDGAVQRLEVISHHRVERRLLGPTALVTTSWRGGGEVHPSTSSRAACLLALSPLRALASESRWRPPSSAMQRASSPPRPARAPRWFRR